MYKIYADGSLIYDSTLEDYVITKGVVTREVNKSGSFVFTILPSHPYYDRIQKLKTIITVYKNGALEFRGRVITEEIGFRNDKTLTCEGELSFLLDSIQRHYSFSGTPAELFIQLINAHNAQVEPEKRFIVGEITVEDDNDYIARSNSHYEDTFSNIKSRLLDTHGGYLHVTRNTDGKPVINYLKDYTFLSRQKIEFGENLCDFIKTNAGNEIATVIIPLGAKIKQEDEPEELTDTDTENGSDSEIRLTIEDINDGLDYIEDAEAIEKYGRIVKVVIWDDVTIQENLLRKGRAYLNELINQNITIELSAIDLSLLDRSIDHFRLGDYIDIVSKPHNLEDRLLLKKISFDLLSPSNDKISLGYTYSTFTDIGVSNQNKNDHLGDTIFEDVTNNIQGIIGKETETLRSLINQTATEITMEVAKNYMTQEQVTSEISTTYKQLNDSFEFMFKDLSTKIDENSGRQEYEEIKKYIRFIDGNILLGQVGNELTLKITKDRISFFESGNEVAYFSNNKLYVTDGEYTNSLRLGKFAFLPRKNGNLSFKKIGE